MVATAKTMAVTKRAKATRAGPPAGPTARLAPSSSSREMPITARMPTPESGLLDEPISPAM